MPILTIPRFNQFFYSDIPVITAKVSATTGSPNAIASINCLENT